MGNEQFAKNLTYLLESGQITVKTILNITGNSSPGLVTMWKNNERQITTKDLVIIANHLGYTVDELLNQDITKGSNANRLDNILFSKVKELDDDKKMAVLQVINAINKDIDKELDNSNNN